MPVTWTCPDCEAVQVDDFAEHAQVECRSCGLVILWEFVLPQEQYNGLMDELDAMRAAADAVTCEDEVYIHRNDWEAPARTGCWYDSDSGEEDE